DAENLFLDTENGFAEEIEHYPLGVAASSAPVTAIIEFDPREVDRSTGKSYTIRGRVRISAVGLTLTNRDAWLIHGARYETESIGDDEFGITTVEVIRR